MTRPRSSSATTFVVIAAVALAGLGFYLNWSRTGDAESAAKRPTKPTEDGIVLPSREKRERTELPRLRISPEKVDLGTVSQCRPMEPVELVLTNEGREPVKIAGWAATCSCVAPVLTQGEVVAPGSFIKVPLRVDPLGLGGKSQRIDFRLEGNAHGGSVRIDYRIESAIIPMPVMVVRPDSYETKVVDLERVDAEGGIVAEKFAIRGIEPPVARFVQSAGDGHAAIEIDFKAIDALAEAGGGQRGLFEWETRGETRRWKSMELSIETDCAACPTLRVRVRNR